MSADNRSTHTDALATLGMILGEGEKRDAIHLAVEPVIANESLIPGTEVGWIDAEKRLVGRGHRCDKPIGIVDPFLKNKVQKGERFWLIVMPRQITSLRHVWSHPDFPVVAEVAEEVTAKDALQLSKDWIDDYARGFGYTGDLLMSHADSTVAGLRRVEGNDSWRRYSAIDYLTGDANLEGESVSAEFWKHYQIVKGETVPDEFQQNFFTCSCS